MDINWLNAILFGVCCCVPLATLAFGIIFFGVVFYTRKKY